MGDDVRRNQKPTLIILGGMQKSGTSWLCNMLVEIVGEAFDNNTRDVREERGLEKSLAAYLTPTYRNRLRKNELQKLILVAKEDGPLVFKTHRKLPKFAVHMDGVKLLYVYRDPRDVLCSALDHGAKERKAGKLPIRGFAKLLTPSSALRWLKFRVLPTANSWLNVEGVTTIRYEDLLTDAHAELQRVVEELGIPADLIAIANVIAKYDAANLSRTEEIGNALHLNKARIGRYKNHLDEGTQERVIEMLGKKREYLLHDAKR